MTPANRRRQMAKPEGCTLRRIAPLLLHTSRCITIPALSPSRNCRKPSFPNCNSLELFFVARGPDAVLRLLLRYRQSGQPPKANPLSQTRAITSEGQLPHILECPSCAAQYISSNSKSSVSGIVNRVSTTPRSEKRIESSQTSGSSANPSSQAPGGTATGLPVPRPVSKT